MKGLVINEDISRAGIYSTRHGNGLLFHTGLAWRTVQCGRYILLAIRSDFDEATFPN